MIARDARYQPNAARWAAVLSELKQMALDGEDPANVVRRLREARALLLT